MRQVAFGLTGLALVLASMATPAFAAVTAPVPEIDGGSLSAGLGLLAGGVLMLRSRLRRR